MKYNIWMIFLTVLGSIQFTYAQFNFKQHKVVKGEDVYSISKEYGTTPEAIYKLNPMAKKGIQPDTFLVLPNVVAAPEKQVDGITFKKHKTKSKETLYSVAKKYKVEVEDIKDHNDFLQTEPLRKGDIVRIPIMAKKVVRKLGKHEEKYLKKNTKNGTTKIYTIQPKDTRYGVARKFGITIPELENMNPNLGGDFPIGMKILVSSEEAFPESAAEAANDPAYELYEVLPKETLYSLGKRYEIPIDSIESLNPLVKDGLVSGMVLRMPNRGGALSLDEPFSQNLEQKILNSETKKIAIMLPFGTDSVDFNDEENVKEHIGKSKVVRLTIDFYSGALMAAEKAKQIGISSYIEVCDTQKSDKRVSKLISEKNLKEFDAVIGPLYDKNVAKASSELSKSGVPVLSPISNKTESKYKNSYQTRPSASILEDKLIAYAKKDITPKNIIIIADTKCEPTRDKLKEHFPEAKVLDPKEGNFIKVEELTEVLGESSDVSTWVFLESKSMELVSNVVPFLKSHKIKLLTTNKTNAYDNESILNQHLSNLNLHYPSVNREVPTTAKGNFEESYIAKYGVRPNKYAIRGYDLTYDLLLRLSAKKDKDELYKSNFATEYIENKFYYKPNLKGGFVNTSCYILSYEEGLEIKVVE